MATFIGEYGAKLDDKGRLIFPSAFKTQVSPGANGRYVVKKDVFSKCLVVYPLEEWNRQAEELKAKLNFFNRDHNRFWREYTRDRAEIEPDEKLGRILIPKRLLDMIDVKKEVVFAGQDLKIELWAKELYSQTPMKDDDFANLAESLFGQ